MSSSTYIPPILTALGMVKGSATVSKPKRRRRKGTGTGKTGSTSVRTVRNAFKTQSGQNKKGKRILKRKAISTVKKTFPNASFRN